MIVRGKRSAGFALVSLLAAASVLFHRSSASHSGRSFLGDTGQYAPTQDVGPLQPPESDVGGSVQGRVTDEMGAPLHGVEVDLIPNQKTGDARWYATRHEWTDAEGRYQFTSAEPGEYFLAVLKDAAPDARYPFAGVYYPAADDESTADRVIVTDHKPTNLLAMRLHRLETVTLKVRVAFEDGSSPSWSNLLFHNLSYPHQAVIGNEAPGISDGHGEFTLPVGFEYYAQAKVDCDTGQRIETRESRPVQQIRIDDSSTVEALEFTIPGQACKLWSPK